MREDDDLLAALAATGKHQGRRIPVVEERRTAAGSGLPAVVRNGRDSNGVGRARVRVLDDSCGQAPGSGRADVRVFWRADSEDMSILNGRDDRKRGELISERLNQWKSVKNA